jgi:hypothetical protein
MERDDAVELAIAIGGVGLFVAALAVVGATYGTESGQSIQAAGRLPLVGVMVLFVVSMGIAGFWLAERGD